jgi:glycosyltransferase involved in cell wall biosynthesis
MKKIDVYSDGLSGGGAEIFLCNLIKSRLLMINDVFSLKRQVVDFQYKKINVLTFYKCLHNSCRKGNYVYIHLSKASFLSFIYLLIYRCHANYFIFHEHTIPEFYYQRSGTYKLWFSLIYLKLRYYIYSICRIKVILGSQKQKQELQRIHNTGKSAIFIYYKLPLMKSVLLKNFKYNLFEKSKPIKFYSISRIEPIKRIDLSISAISVVAKAFPQIKFQFDIFGTGSQVENLTKISKNYTNENLKICFQGYLDDYNKVLNHNFLLVSSEIEGFGLSVLEALLLKKFVIAMKRTNIYSYNDFQDTFENFYLSKDDSFISFVLEIEEKVSSFLRNNLKSDSMYKVDQSWPSFTIAADNLKYIIYES